MAQGKVEICGVNTAKLPVLNEEEKEALIARIKAGDTEAKEEYIKGNLRLVLSVIKRFGGSNENPDDLFQIGCIGLIKAINNFNTELDVKFSTYAVPMIITCRENRRNKKMTRKQAILKAIEVLKENASNKDTEMIIEKLNEIKNELPLSHWTNSSILDSIEEYAFEHEGMLPLVSDLIKKNKLPSTTVIKTNFKISSIEYFYKKYFPNLQIVDNYYSPYKKRNEEYFLDVFIKNYKRIKREKNIKYVPIKIYDKYKDKNTPHSSTIMKKNNCNSYKDLLILCELEKPQQKTTFTFNVMFDDNSDNNQDILNILNNLKQ